MKNIAKLLFEAKILKEIPRSGYHFLGAGKESVAEHSFMITFIAYTMAKLLPEVDALRLLSMCLVHDLPESRIGDLNYVQKKYVTVDEKRAALDATSCVPFGASLRELIDEFNACETLEAKLAKDADQLAFILEMKAISDIGSRAPDNWLPVVLDRLTTETGKKIGKSIMETEWDAWWRDNYSE